MRKATSATSDAITRGGGAPPARIAIAVLLLSAAAGLGIGSLPMGAALGAAGFLAMVALFGVVRMAFATSLAAVRERDEPVHADPPYGSTLRIPRLVYYGGVLSISLLTLRLPLNFTLSDWLFFAALALTILELLAVHRRLMISVPTLVLLGALLFGVGSLLSSLHAVHPVQSVATGARFVFIVTAWFWLGTVLLQTVAHVMTAVRLWTLSAAITGAGAIAQLTWGDVIPGTTPSWGRMTGFTTHMNDLGAITSLALVPALYLATQSRNTFGYQKFVSLATILLIGAGLVLSGSVGSFLAAMAAVVLWLAVGAVRLRTILIAGVVISAGLMLGLGIVEQAGGSSPLTRVQRVVESRGEEGSLWSRLEGYQAAWDGITRDPFIGAGLDDESSRTDVRGLELQPDGNAVYARHQVHNVLLGSWYGAGLLGLLGVLAILVAILRAGVLTVNHARSRKERFLAASLLASYVGFLVFAMGAVVLYQRYGWIAAVLVLAVWSQQTRRLEVTA